MGPSCAMATRIQVYLVYTRESRVWKNKMSYDKVTRYAVITEESLNLYQHNKKRSAATQFIPLDIITHVQPLADPLKKTCRSELFCFSISTGEESDIIIGVKDKTLRDNFVTVLESAQKKKYVHPHANTEYY